MITNDPQEPQKVRLWEVLVGFAIFIGFTLLLGSCLNVFAPPIGP